MALNKYAELIHLYTAPTGFDVQDNEPNMAGPGGGPAATFDLHLEAVAGNVYGGSGADYVLAIMCIDDMMAAPNAAMSVGPIGQQLSSANGWVAGGPAGDYKNKQVFPIAVPLDVRGHVFHYEGTLVSANSEVVSFIASNRFILV